MINAGYEGSDHNCRKKLHIFLQCLLPHTSMNQRNSTSLLRGDEALSNFCYAEMQNNKIMIDITHCHCVNADNSYQFHDLTVFGTDLS